jgi:hypothetical protein
MDDRKRIATLEHRVVELEKAEDQRRRAWYARYWARDRRAKRIIATYAIVGAITGAAMVYKMYWPPWRLPWTALVFAPVAVPAIIGGGVIAWPLWWASFAWDAWQDAHDPRKQLERRIDERRRQEGLPPMFDSEGAGTR